MTSSGVNLNNRELRRGDGFFRAYSLIILHSIDSIVITARDTAVKATKRDKDLCNYGTCLLAYSRYTQ